MYCAGEIIFILEIKIIIQFETVVIFNGRATIVAVFLRANICVLNRLPVVQSTETFQWYYIRTTHCWSLGNSATDFWKRRRYTESGLVRH